MAIAEFERPAASLDKAGKAFFPTPIRQAILDVEDDFVLPLDPTIGIEVTSLTEDDWGKIVTHAKSDNLVLREEAFNVIYEEYSPRLQRHVRNILRVDEQEAQYFAQEALIKAWKKIRETDEDLKLSGWLFTITTRVCLSELRRRKRTEVGIDDYLVLPPSANQKIDINPTEIIELAETTQDVDLVLAQLDPKYREVLELRVYGNHEYQELAVILGISFDAARSLLHRARSQFKERWAEFQTRRSRQTPEKVAFDALVKQTMPELGSFFDETDLDSLPKICILARTLFASGKPVEEIVECLKLESSDEVYALVDNARDNYSDLWPHTIEALGAKRRQKEKIRLREILDLRTRHPKLTCQEIADKLGVTCSSVKGVIKRHASIPRVKKGADEFSELDNQVKGYIQAGYGNKEVSRLLKREPHTIRDSIQRLIDKGALKRRRYPDRNFKRVAREVKNHTYKHPDTPLNLAQIGRKLGMHRQMVHRYYNQLIKRQAARYCARSREAARSGKTLRQHQQERLNLAKARVRLLRQLFPGIGKLETQALAGLEKNGGVYLRAVKELISEGFITPRH